jgi:glycosyltransferase involved in cell wall biosynthesis
MINLYMLCDANPCESFGQIGLELARYLTRWGHGANIHSHGDRQHPAQDEELQAITARPLVPSAGAIVMGYPDFYFKHGDIKGPTMAVTMWETSKLPASWLPILNRLDAIVTPSTFCRDMFIENGVTVPIHVIPLGIDPIFQYAERDTEQPFTFYVCADRGKRKGGALAVKAFLTAFGDNPDYRLIVKQRADWAITTFTSPNIHNVIADLSPYELNHLYREADVCISAHRGEGWGLIPREFSSTGGVSLATNWSGTADDIDQWGYPIQYTLKKADARPTLYPTEDLGYWAEPDFDTLVDLLKDVANSREVFIADARRKSDNARRLYNWEKFSRDVLEVWNDL